MLNTFYVPLGHLYVFLEKMSIQFLIALFLLLNFMKSLYILDIIPLPDIRLKIFSTVQ